MSEASPFVSPKLLLGILAAVLVVAAGIFGAMKLSESSSDEHADGRSDEQAARSGSPRYAQTDSSDPRHIGKSRDKTEEERIAGKPSPYQRREPPKEMVARISADAQEELRKLRARGRRSDLDPDREERLKILVQAQNHWKMTEAVSKNPKLRSQAYALNRRLANWVRNSDDMDRETFDAEFRALRSALGELRKKNGSTGRRPVKKSTP